jgi:dolichol kinase
MIGIFGPILIDPATSPTAVHIGHYAGVISIGIGDSLAAIYGRRFGRRRWHRQTAKTIEGSTAMFIGQTLAALVILYCLLKVNDAFAPMTIMHMAAVSALCTGVEVICSSMDNLVVPLVGYCLL